MKMLEKLYIKDNGEWALYPYIIRYTHKGGQVEQMTDDVSWFEEFADKWEDFKIDEVIELEYTNEQLDRLAEVQEMPVKYFDEIRDYVIDGTIKIDSEIFADKNILKLKNENAILEGTVMELVNMLAMVTGGTL